jgi:hypothetical protein
MDGIEEGNKNFKLKRNRKPFTATPAAELNGKTLTQDHPLGPWNFGRTSR